MGISLNGKTLLVTQLKLSDPSISQLPRLAVTPIYIRKEPNKFDKEIG